MHRSIRPGAALRGTLTVASKAEPETLDQMWSTGDTIYWITANIYEGLYTYDANLNPH